MFKFRSIVYLVLLIQLISVENNSHNIRKKNNEKEKEQFIEELITRMTLEEKVGQLTQVVGKDKLSKDLLREGKIGSYLVGIDGADSANPRRL